MNKYKVFLPPAENDEPVRTIEADFVVVDVGGTLVFNLEGDVTADPTIVTRIYAPGQWLKVIKEK